MITFKRGSLFEALDSDRTDVVLAHAVNCRAAWGSGIAVSFRELYPRVFEQYKQYCTLKGDSLLGSYTEHETPYGEKILCLYTSRGYGSAVDPLGVILESTRNALQNYREYNANANIHMPKINSGRFGVPWNFTESILNELLYNSGVANENLRFTVWEP